jgi:hypothetical protein
MQHYCVVDHSRHKHNMCSMKAPMKMVWGYSMTLSTNKTVVAIIEVCPNVFMRNVYYFGTLEVRRIAISNMHTFLPQADRAVDGSAVVRD